MGKKGSNKGIMGKKARMRRKNGKGNWS